MPAPSQKKTDNHNLGAKLALRRWFLERYHADAHFSVFDCCQGSGTIWRELGKSFEFAYWGVDLKKAPGRLQVDSIRILELEGGAADVVDVDAYGSPWKHWRALLPNVAKPTTVFLTEGIVKRGGGSIAGEVLDAAGMRFPTLKTPGALALKMLAEEGWRYAIAAAGEHGLRVAAIVESLNPGGRARYFGVRLEPERPSGTP